MKELLLQLCRYPYEAAGRDNLSKLISEVDDWPYLVKLINSHGIIALAAYNLKEAGLEMEIPRDAWSTIEKGYLQSVLRNAWLTEQWKEVNSLLNKAGIKHIILKGMALEHTIYGSRGLRQMNDNDILIGKEESVIAWELLLQEGFRREPLKSPLYKGIGPGLYQHLPTLYKNGYAIEIHDKLVIKNLVYDTYSDLFGNSVEIEIDGTKAFTLPHDLHLSYLIGHYQGHASSGDCQLRLYTDIHMLNNKSTIEIAEEFIHDPMQGNKKKYRKAAYKADLRLLSKKDKVLYVTGDIFPSIKWMQRRYNCHGLKLLFYYLMRIGKLSWLI